MDFPAYRLPPSPVITPFSPESVGMAAAGTNSGIILGGAASSTWPAANVGYFYPFTLTDFATAYQLLFWVGATSSGNIDVGIYDTQKNRIVSAGSTAMSATVNTVQELNITDTALAPGEYLLAGGCDNTTGTVFCASGIADETALSGSVVYEQTGLTGPTLPNPCVPVVTANATPTLAIAIGVQLRSVF